MSVMGSSWEESGEGGGGLVLLLEDVLICRVQQMQ